MDYIVAFLPRFGAWAREPVFGVNLTRKLPTERFVYSPQNVLVSPFPALFRWLPNLYAVKMQVLLNVCNEDKRLDLETSNFSQVPIVAGKPPNDLIICEAKWSSTNR